MTFLSWHGLCNGLGVSNELRSRNCHQLRGKIMITKTIENGLTLLGALIVLFGFMSALNTAFADGVDDIDATLKIEVSTTP